ncbi:MAG: phytanoyl-CoA dioxygenase family protein [Candidatus Latescibacteria bacterium]|nr:phytanoyl-CoA dioxygenase family protein [Candidatus Latescibacterota bacterium]
MTDLSISPAARRLSPEQKKQFEEWGYLTRLPLFAPAAVPTLQRRLHEFEALLPEGIAISGLNMWHKANRWIHDLARTPAILDYVEDLIGPDFYQWGGGFFVKYPGDGKVVPWHQDAQYWPLKPKKTVTVSVAFYDCTPANGGMEVVRGSHKQGDMPHHTVDGDRYLLGQELDPDQIDADRIAPLEALAGEICLHDDTLAHGSGVNKSDGIRASLTMRFSPTQVKCDLGVWPTFESSMARGTDSHRHNPEAKVPGGDGFPVRSFQHSSEFD